MEDIKVISELEQVYEISETSTILRIYNFPLDKDNFLRLQQLKSSIETYGLGSLSFSSNDLYEIIDLDKEFEEDYNLINGIIKINKASDEIFFFTKSGLSIFLQKENLVDIRYIKLVFILKGFETYNVKFIPIDSTGSQENVNNKVKLSGVKYVKALNSEAQEMIPKDILSWITPETDGNIKNVIDVWRPIASKRLICTFTSEFSVDSDTIELNFKGDSYKRIKLKLEEFDASNYFFTINSIAEWIYVDGKDIDSRHSIFNHQISLAINEEIGSLEEFAKILKKALENSILAYRYLMQDVSKQLMNNLIDLNKVLFDYIGKIRENTSNLVASMWKDFTAVLGLMFLNFALKKPELPDIFFDALSIGLCFYLLASILLNSRIGFWFYKNLKTTLKEWRNKIYLYLTDEQFNEFVDVPLKRAQDKYKVTFGIIFVLYLILIAAILILTFEVNLQSIFKGN